MTTKVVRTICFDSHSKCGVLVHVDGNKIVKVEGDPNHPVSRGMVCCKALSAAQIHDHPERLKYPMRRVGPRGSGKWERITWDEALDEMEAKIREIIGKYGKGAFIIGQGTGRGSNHWHMRCNASFGLPGWGLVPTHVCLMPNLLPTMFTYGYFAFIDSADVRRANTIVEWGINPLTAWPGLQATQLLDAKARGGQTDRGRPALYRPRGQGGHLAPGQAGGRRGARHGVDEHPHRARAVRQRVRRQLDVRISRTQTAGCSPLRRTRSPRSPGSRPRKSERPRG